MRYFRKGLEPLLLKGDCEGGDMAKNIDLIHSVNPATEERMQSFSLHSDAEIEALLLKARKAFNDWRKRSFADRADLMKKVSNFLIQNKARFSAIITAEMGKPIMESESEIEKCAWNCLFYAENAEPFLREEIRESNANLSYIQYPPLGVVLAIMPWNFPFWQVFRFAAPALMAGNTAILKHASNVPQCALAIEETFKQTGFPEGAFQTVLIPGRAVSTLIEHPAIAAVTLTGSESSGVAVASSAGRALKKTVLELGGSDPFIVLEDADMGLAVQTGVRARYLNAGQSCIAAKRFIIVESAFCEFQDRFIQAVAELKVGDPMSRATQVGPLARGEFRDDLERQIQASMQQGANVALGGHRRPGKGYYFEPTILTGVQPDMPAGCEEVFGPVAALIHAKDVEEAIQIANSTPYGLGSNLWTSDVDRARQLSRRIEAGQVFINGMVASDPRLPFGGIKHSGYGRELSDFGIREFVNIQTVWIGC
jgi:acyl-CoA reductase-like NAD-dependent aldehyde dehydrogenase